MDKKNHKERNDINLIKGDRSFYITLGACLVVFLGAIALLIASFNNLISKHDQNLSGEICTLVSEKMNNSIDSMTGTVSGIASVLSAQNFETPDEIYSVLKDYEKKDYLSIGFIDSGGKMYATPEEQAEFKKWQLSKTAIHAAPVSMSMPYRSSLFGQPVVTIFSEFEYGDVRHGYLFLTYMLSDLQKIAATQSLGNDIGIWLMNAESANIIQCAGADSHAIGSWTNAYLDMQNINTQDRNVYREWIDRVRSGEDNIGISYSIDHTIYSQFCSKIVSMPGWYVVVRIPSSALSATMNTFRNYVLEFLAVLLLVVIVLIANMYRLSKRENTMLTQLSIHDPLTGALNRRAFDFAAEKKLSHVKEAALIFFDIDYFKQVNDQFGHDAGDRLLIAFSDTLKKNFGDSGIISRFGGDEFVVLTDMDSTESVTSMLDTVTEDVHAIDLTDTRTGTGSFMISFSAGAAIFPMDADSLPHLKKCADMALYSTKESGRNGYSWFKPGMIDPKAVPDPYKVDEITHKPVIARPVEAPTVPGQVTAKTSGKKVVKKIIKRKIIKKVVKKAPTPPDDQTATRT